MNASLNAAFRRLDALQSLLGKYRHRWGANPSARLQSWAVEYDALVDQIKSAGWLRWAGYCESRHLPVDVNAGDHLA
jgi:hypothetical protein